MHKTPSDEQNGADQLLPQNMTDDEEIPSGDQKYDDQVRPKVMPDDDEITSEEEEGAERIGTKYEILYNEI